MRGEHLSPDHWLDLFRILGLPRGTSLEKLLFGDLLRVADTIVAKTAELKVRSLLEISHMLNLVNMILLHILLLK